MPFAQSAAGTAKYWLKVLRAWESRWKKKAACNINMSSAPKSAMEAITERIREKIGGNLKQKLDTVKQRDASTGRTKQTPIVISDSESVW